VSKEVLKIVHPFSKSSLEDLLKFFQRHFPKKFRKFGPWTVYTKQSVNPVLTYYAAICLATNCTAQL